MTAGPARARDFAADRPLGRGLHYELAGFPAATSARVMTARTAPAFIAEVRRLGDTPR